MCILHIYSIKVDIQIKNTKQIKYTLLKRRFWGISLFWQINKNRDTSLLLINCCWIKLDWGTSSPCLSIIRLLIDFFSHEYLFFNKTWTWLTRNGKFYGELFKMLLQLRFLDNQGPIDYLRWVEHFPKSVLRNCSNYITVLSGVYNKQYIGNEGYGKT